MSVLFDIQGIQSPAHAERGIARYLLELALALEKWHPGRISQFVLNPDLAVPGVVEPLAAGGRLTFSDRLDPSAACLYHIGSAFEYVHLDRIWPQAVHEGRMRLVVTLYDLIPMLFPDIYLSNPATNSWYRTRLQLLRRADRLLAISGATAVDGARELGMPADRIVTVGAGVSERFRRPASREDAFAAVRASLPWIEPGYVLYVGGIEPRKNIDRLLEAYTHLAPDLRARHQLLVVCRVLPAELARIERRLRKLGVADRVRFPGYLPDELLVSLYQAAELFVFPSLYEGSGLPIAEAQACGAPVISSRSSALVELVRDDEALFDPADTRSIAATLDRALRDVSLRARLLEPQLDERHSWRAVADRTVAAYDEVLALPRRPRRRRRRIALVTPLPPQRSGVADYSYRLLRELQSLCAVDAYVNVPPGEVRAPEGVHVLTLWHLESMERARGRYDAVVYCLGNSEFHADALAMLRRRRGVVLAHDVRLSGLYTWTAAHRPELESRGFHGALRDMYGHRLPPDVGAAGWLSYEDANRYGVYMAAEAIALSQQFLVHSEHAAQIARLEALQDDDRKIEVLGFACPDPEEFPRREEPSEPVIATFGLVAPVKQTEKVIQAFGHLAGSHPAATLAVVGPEGAAGALESCRRLVARLCLGDRVEVTGGVDDERFRSWMGRTTLAVQLRETSNGESAGSVADCFAAGTPTVVPAFGSWRELPDDCVAKVDREISAESLAGVLDALLRDENRRTGIGRAGLAFARSHSFGHVAAHLLEVLERASPAAWPAAERAKYANPDASSPQRGPESPAPARRHQHA